MHSIWMRRWRKQKRIMYDQGRVGRSHRLDGCSGEGAGSLSLNEGEFGHLRMLEQTWKEKKKAARLTA